MSHPYFNQQFSISVNEARSVKEHAYQDAFANVECEGCGEVQPVFQVVAYYGGVTLMNTFVTASAIPGAVAQSVELFEILARRIDAANLAWEEEERRREAERSAAASDKEDLTRD